MKTRLLLIASITTLMMSCDSKKETMQLTVDSLRNELQANRRVTGAMVEIGTLLDSIDASRKVLRTHMLEGTDYRSYVARVRDINQYVKKTQRKIRALEKTAKKAHVAGFMSTIKKLKRDLDIRNQELATLQALVNRYKNENEDLVRTVSLQKAEIEDKMNQIKSKQEETAQLEAQVNHLLSQAKLDQGESYFAQALAVEETANRTKFAPKKKKSSRRQALELYKLALLHGKDEAQAKINWLEKSM